MTTKTTALLLLITISMVTLLCAANDPTNEDVHSNGNHSDSNGNQTHGGEAHASHGHGHGVHVAGWQYDYVKTPLLITIFLLFALIAKLGFHHVDYLSKIMPESCLLIVLGTIVGIIVYVAADGMQVTMSNELFFLYLLPPIILDSAYSLHDRVFSDNIGTILLYAVVGTILNCFLIGCTLFGLAQAGAMGTIEINMVECLVFSGLIVAVDPVAVLAIFQEIRVNNTLYFLVFGESLLNDAVTVVIYNVMNAFNGMDSIPVAEILKGIAAFFVVSLGGLIVGIIWGIITSFVTRFTKHVRVVEPLALFIFAYASYLSAELFHFSGIISCIGCGLVQAQYARHNISNKSQTTVKYFSKMMSSTCDCIIFMFLGLALVRDHKWHTGFTCWSVVLCLVYRFIVVYALTFLANKRRKRKINMVEQFIMAYGGLRGAVAFSLVAMIDAKDLHVQPMFLTTTLVVILFTVFVQGMTIKPLVGLLRVSRDTQKSVCLIEEIHNNVTDHVMAGVEEISGHTGENAMREYVEYYDDKYIKKWLMRCPVKKDHDIMELYQNMALQQHYDAIGAKGSALSMDVVSTVQPKKVDKKGFTNDPNMMRTHADHRHSASNKRGIFARLRRRDHRDHDLSSLASAEPRVDDLHELLRYGATEDVYHQRYDKNLISEEETDLLAQLHEKQLRRDRFLRAKTLFLHNPERHKNMSVLPPRRSLGDQGLEVIMEGMAMKTGSEPNSFPNARDDDHAVSPSEHSHLLRSDDSTIEPAQPRDTTDGKKPAEEEWYDNVPSEPNPEHTVVDVDPKQGQGGAGNKGRKGSLLRQDAKDPTSPPVNSQQPSYPLEVINKTGSTATDPDRESKI